MLNRQQEAVKNTGFVAAIGGVAFGTVGYVLSGAVNCQQYIPELLNQTYAAANNLAAVTGSVVNNNVIELQRVLSGSYIIARTGTHLPGYLPFFQFKDEMMKFSTTVTTEVVKYTYDLTQTTFMQSCLDALSPSVLVPRFFLFGAAIGAGLGAAHYLFGEETQADEDSDDDLDAEQNSHATDDMDVIKKEMPKGSQDASSNAINASLRHTSTFFKRQKELRDLHEKYGESANLRVEYGIGK